MDATNVAPATFGDSSKLVVGDIVLAVGNPLGLQSSVTEGIVSAVGRTVTESGTVTLPNVIQTSAPINPGNSGGALVDLAGEVVGIPTLAESIRSFARLRLGSPSKQYGYRTSRATNRHGSRLLPPRSWRDRAE